MRERVRVHLRNHRDAYVLGAAVMGTVGAVSAALLLGGKDAASTAVERLPLPALPPVSDPAGVAAALDVVSHRKTPVLHEVSGHLRTVVTGRGSDKARAVREISPYVRGVPSA